MKKQQTNLDPNRRKRYLLIGVVGLAIVLLSITVWKMTGEESGLAALSMGLKTGLI